MAEVLRMQAGRTGNEHVVQAGDTLSGIAARYGCTVRALQQANNLQDADTIRVGQRLTLP
jgi:LysM repeat protein